MVCRSVLLGLRNVSHKSCGENKKNKFAALQLYSGNRAEYEIMWKNNVQPDRPWMAI
jgi:hypothetical protein